MGLLAGLGNPARASWFREFISFGQTDAKWGLGVQGMGVSSTVAKEMDGLYEWSLLVVERFPFLHHRPNVW